jgi:hypothetical protein
MMKSIGSIKVRPPMPNFFVKCTVKTPWRQRLGFRLMAIAGRLLGAQIHVGWTGSEYIEVASVNPDVDYRGLP